MTQSLLDFWRQSTQLNGAQIGMMDQMRMMQNMDHSMRRAEAQVDHQITGEYEPPEQDLSGAIWFNNLIVGDEAVETLQKAMQGDQQKPPSATEPETPTPPQPRPQPAPPHPPPTPPDYHNGNRLWGPSLIALALLLSGGILSWSVLNQPQSPPSSPPVYVWDMMPEDNVPAEPVPAR